MDNDFLNKENVKKILFMAFIIILMLVGLMHIGAIAGVIGKIISIFMPFIIGAAIAFIFNVPLRGVENGLFKNKKFKGKRPVSYLITLLLVVAVITAAVSVIIPKLVETAKTIADEFTLANLEAARDFLIGKFPFLTKYIEKLDLTTENLVTQASKFVTDVFSGKFQLTQNASGSSMLGSAFSAVTNVANGFLNFLIGFAFSIYVLFRKEALGRQARQVTYALFKGKTADKILDICSLSFRTFNNFIKGQFLEACILGLLFFIFMSIFRFPYALLIAILIAITALIPVFGAFLGGGISALLILVVSPKQALMFLILFIVLQQLEGKLIYPHVVGSSVGLPSVWVLMAITVGAKIMGVAGMLIFVPLCSVLYALFRRFILQRLDEKNVPMEKYTIPYSKRAEATALPGDSATDEEPQRSTVEHAFFWNRLFASHKHNESADPEGNPDESAE